MEQRPFSCGLDAVLAVLGGKWKPLVLFHLNGAPRRFGELRRLVAGISEKVLIQQLRETDAGRDPDPHRPSARSRPVSNTRSTGVRPVPCRDAGSALRLGRSHLGGVERNPRLQRISA